MDLKTEQTIRMICDRGPIEFADMLGIVERYQPANAPDDFAAYVQAERVLGAPSNEEAAMRAVKKLQAEEDHRYDVAARFRGHPSERQVREALGIK